MLNRGIVELGFVRTPFERGQLSCRYGAPVPMAAVMPARFAVGERPDVVTLAELSDVPLVIYRRYQALLSERFRQAGASLVVVCLNDDSRTTCNWARRGFGVGLVPLQMCETVNMEGLLAKRVADEALVTRLALVRERGRRLSPAGERFLACFSSWSEE